jgi:hypothetical protein
LWMYIPYKDVLSSTAYILNCTFDCDWKLLQ